MTADAAGSPAAPAARWSSGVPLAGTVIPLPDLVARLSRSLRLSSFAGICGIVGMVPVYVFLVRADWILVLMAVAALHQVVVRWALARCRQGAVARAAVVFCLSDWAVVLVALAIIPACAPALVPIVIARVVSTLPYLERDALLRLVGASLGVGVVVGALSRVDLLHAADQVPSWVVTAFVVFFVPVGIAIVGLDLWQHSTSLLQVAQRALSANSALTASERVLAEQADELRRSRARLVASADLERLRVERDLHDGAQQTLVSLCLGMSLLAERLEEDGPLRAELRRLEEVGQEALTELRELAHGMYPPLLATQGLAPALTAVLRRTRVPVRSEVSPVARCAPEVEAAVYFCCREALQNLDKHAGPDVTATLTLAEDEGRLRFTLADDGCGFDVPGRDDPTVDGRGLVNMQDRIAAVGGCLDIASAPGRGTAITGVVPAAPVREEGTRAVGSTP